MNTNAAPLSPARAAAAVFVAASSAIVIATGLLTLVLVTVAATRGESLTDLLSDVFPRFRGGGGATGVPAYGYVMFFSYVTVAAVVAVLTRRWLTRRWARSLS